MKNLLLPLLLVGCGETVTDYPLSKELYEWNCYDFEDFTEVVVTTETCDDQVKFIVAELHLDDGRIQKTNLKKPAVVDCHWEENFLLTDEICMNVEGVALIAWAE